jgi:hypothetical protein
MADEETSMNATHHYLAAPRQRRLLLEDVLARNGAGLFQAYLVSSSKKNRSAGMHRCV